MTLADLKSAAELLPSGSAITISRDALLAAITQLDPRSPPTPAKTERLLTVSELARRLGASRKYVYANAKRWPFTRQLGARLLRFEETGLERWLSRQR